MALLRHIVTSKKKATRGERKISIPIQNARIDVTADQATNAGAWGRISIRISPLSAWASEAEDNCYKADMDRKLAREIGERLIKLADEENPALAPRTVMLP